MTEVLNPYRELEVNINTSDFENFCMDTLKAIAEQEHLQNFEIFHDQK